MSHSPAFRSNAPALDHLCDSGRGVVGWLTFWLDDLCFQDFLWLGVVMIKAAGCVALDRWRRIWLRVVDSQLLGSLKASSKNRMTGSSVVGMI